MKRYVWILLFAVILGLCRTAYARNWTDASGKYTFEADLVGVEGESARLSDAHDGKEYLIPLRFLSDADQAFIQQAQNPKAAIQNNGGIPPAILARIKENAANKWEDNFAMQKYQIEEQGKAYLYLQRFNDNRIPGDVLAIIKGNATSHWRDNYTMQKYQIEQQIAAYVDLQSFSDARVPADILANIRRNATKRWRDNYTMQKYQIEQQIGAYLSLHDGQ